MKWTISDIERIKNKGGLKVKLTSPLSKDRTVEVITNGKTETVKMRKAMTHEESELQQNCVKTFQLMYPKLKLRLFSIPNGSYRTAITAAILKAEGCTPGVPDVFLAVPKKQYGGMFIEFKTTTGRLSVYQIQFIKEVRNDYYCVVIRSVEEFLREIKKYLEKQTLIKV